MVGNTQPITEQVATEQRRQSDEEALATFKACVEKLEALFRDRFGIPMPSYAKVSNPPKPKHGDKWPTLKDMEDLVVKTRDLVQKNLKNDAWLMWAMAQQVSLPVKIDACINKGVSYYHVALSGTLPGSVGKMLLYKCLEQVHKDIVTCWNMKDEDRILNSTEFQQLMLYLVKDVQDKSHSAQPPSFDRISQFVSLVAATTAPIAPPAAILGLSYVFAKWVSETILEKIPEVERMIMAYTIDLILVLKSLFGFTLKPDLAGSTNWNVLKEAFEDYERSSNVQQNHNYCRSALQQHDRNLDRDGLRNNIRKLLDSL